ncbi:MAG TPA: hypothetical protein VK108_00815 [Pseudogracilibacillus sp.]|nr:hypothetical protein [Pseudogracilibacillus sp.]
MFNKANSIAKHENGVILWEADANKSCHGAIDPLPVRFQTAFV